MRVLQTGFRNQSEPGNFVTLREIQPWLHELQDTVHECNRQAIIISHHPEIVDDMARSNGKWFSRKDNGPVQAGEYPTDHVLPHGMQQEGITVIGPHALCIHYAFNSCVSLED